MEPILLLVSNSSRASCNSTIGYHTKHSMLSVCLAEWSVHSAFLLSSLSWSSQGFYKLKTSKVLGMKTYTSYNHNIVYDPTTQFYLHCVGKHESELEFILVKGLVLGFAICLKCTWHKFFKKSFKKDEEWHLGSIHNLPRGGLWWFWGGSLFFPTMI